MSTIIHHIQRQMAKKLILQLLYVLLSLFVNFWL
jgi:hypothetical protein